MPYMVTKTSHSGEPRVLGKEITNSLSGNYFTKVYNFSFLSGIQGVHLKVKAEKVEFIINIFSAN